MQQNFTLMIITGKTVLLNYMGAKIIWALKRRWVVIQIFTVVAANHS